MRWLEKRSSPLRNQQTCLGIVPSDCITNICGEPVRVLTKAMRSPSGEKSGCESVAGLFVNRVKWVPSLLAVHISPLQANAILLPSGESAGRSTIRIELDTSATQNGWNSDKNKTKEIKTLQLILIFRSCISCLPILLADNSNCICEAIRV